MTGRAPGAGRRCRRLSSGGGCKTNITNYFFSRGKCLKSRNSPVQVVHYCPPRALLVLRVAERPVEGRRGALLDVDGDDALAAAEAQLLPDGRAGQRLVPAAGLAEVESLLLLMVYRCEQLRRRSLKTELEIPTCGDIGSFHSLSGPKREGEGAETAPGPTQTPCEINIWFFSFSQLLCTVHSLEERVFSERVRHPLLLLLLC